MNARRALLVVLCVSAAIACTFLGFWQLDRHRERQVAVREQAARMSNPPVGAAEVLSGASQFDNRRVLLTGQLDLANEIVLMNRTRRGAPGVHLFTPMILAGTDSAIMINRGWVYSPDGATVDLAQWRAGITPSDTNMQVSNPIEVSGIVVHHPADSAALPLSSQSLSARRISRLRHENVEALLPYRVAKAYVQLLPADTNVRSGVPTPVPPAAGGPGPHLSYAVQWFAFAAISLAGCAALLIHGRRTP